MFVLNAKTYLRGIKVGMTREDVLNPSLYRHRRGHFFIMRTSFSSFVVLSAVSSSLAAWVPLSQLQNRANSSFLDCLDSAGLDPVVQGESDYATDAAAFNLRYALWRLWRGS